jgi:hypothetical protein
VQTAGQPPQMPAAAVVSAQAAAAAAAAVTMGDICQSRSECPMTMTMTNGHGESRDSFMSMIKQMPSANTGNAASGTTFDNLSQVLAAALASHPAAATGCTPMVSQQQQQQQQQEAAAAHTGGPVSAATTSRGPFLRSPLEMEPAWTSSRHSPQPDPAGLQDHSGRSAGAAAAAAAAAAGGSDMMFPAHQRAASSLGQAAAAAAVRQQQQQQHDITAGHAGQVAVACRVSHPNSATAGGTAAAAAGGGGGMAVLPAAGAACPSSWLPEAAQEQLSERCEGWDLGW